jgi:hypothetical protein
MRLLQGRKGFTFLQRAWPLELFYVSYENGETMNHAPAAFTGHKPQISRHDEFHPPQQFRKFVNVGKFTAIVCGYQCKPLYCDEQDRLPGRGMMEEK